MRILLFGYYGYGNMGDEQLLDDTVRLIHELPVTSSIVVANGPCSVPFQSFNRWNLLAWVFQLRSSQGLIFGGGSVFQSKTGMLSLLYYLLIVQLARMVSCPVILLCHGWGPFQSLWHERLASWVLRYAHRSWRLPGPQCFSNDPVFCDLTLTQPIGSLSRPSGVVGVCMPSSTIDALKQCLESYRIVTLGVSSNDDADESLHDLWDVQHLSFSYVVTDRFHGAIWASRHGIPWVAISTDPKLVHLAQSAGQPCYDTLDQFLLIGLDQPVDGTHLQGWVRSHAAIRPLIKEWLYAAITV